MDKATWNTLGLAAQGFLDRAGMKAGSEEEGDPINHPHHYTSGQFETILVIEDAVADPVSFLHGTLLRYLLRWRHKGGLVDLKKAQWYLNRLIQTIEALERQVKDGDRAGDNHRDGSGVEESAGNPNATAQRGGESIIYSWEAGSPDGGGREIGAATGAAAT